MKKPDTLWSRIKDGIFGAVVAHFVVVLFIWIFSFGTTIPYLYFLWIGLLPVPILVGGCAGLLTSATKNLVRKNFSFAIAGVATLISYPMILLLTDTLVFELKILPDPLAYNKLIFGLEYLFTGVIVEFVIAILITLIWIMWAWISSFFLSRK